MPGRIVLLVAVGMALALGGAGDAAAQPSPYGAGDPGADPSLTPAEKARVEAWREAAEYEKATGYKQPEKLLDRPSGFWTSTRPARGGAYRWRIMAVAALVLGVTVFFVLRLLRRTSQARA